MRDVLGKHGEDFAVETWNESLQLSSEPQRAKIQLVRVLKLSAGLDKGCHRFQVNRRPARDVTKTSRRTWTAAAVSRWKDSRVCLVNGG